MGEDPDSEVDSEDDDAREKIERMITVVVRKDSILTCEW